MLGGMTSWGRLAFGTACTFHAALAFRANKMLKIALNVDTIAIRFRWGITMVTATDNLSIICVVDVNGNTFIKNVAFAIPQRATHRWILAVRHNSTIKLEHILEASLHHPAAELLATNPTCAVR
jgi:hypothetical protein